MSVKRRHSAAPSQANPAPGSTRPVGASRRRNPLRRFFGALRTQLTLALWVPAVIAVAALGFEAVTVAQSSERDRQVTSVLYMSGLIRDYLDALNTESRAAFELTGVDYTTAAEASDVALNEVFNAIDNSDGTLPPSLLDLATELRAGSTDQTDQLRMAVQAKALPPAGVLGVFLNMRAMSTLVPQDFATDVSSEPVRHQLNAMAQAWLLSARLDTEEILARLWAQGDPRVSPADVSAAMRETDLAQSALDLALAKVDTPADTGAWSPDVAQARQVFASADGVESMFVPLALMNEDTKGEYITQVSNRAIDTRATAANLVNDASALASSQSRKLNTEIAVALGLAVLTLVLAVGMMWAMTRRVINPIVGLVRATKKRAVDLPRRLDAIERGASPEELERIVVPHAGPELKEFAGGLNELVDTAVALATKEAQQRAAVVGMLRTVAHRQAALVNRQLELLDKYERHEVDPVFLSRLFNFDHVTTQMRRMCDSLLVLAGASPVRRTTPPLSLVDVVRGASSQIQQYSRVDLDVWYDPRVHGHKVSDLTLLLAELLDNATKYSHPDTRVTVTFTRGTDAALVTIADQGIGFDDAAVGTAQDLVDASDPDHFEMFDRLGLQTVARLCQRTGATVSFAGGTGISGTRVAVRIPDVLLADPGAGAGMRLATAPTDETFDDAVNRPASVTLYGSTSG